ncbi:MAG: LemA family protein [Patescibacteria group bacterium]
MILTIILVILGVLILWAILIYNGLITMRNRTQEAWSDIDVQLKRRYDLIPNLIETVKGYAGHEKTVLQNVTEARTRAMAAEEKGDVKAAAQAENMLAGTLKTLFAVAENYPNLKANENFLELQRDLRDTEDKIQASRRFYNGNVRDFNIKQETFPSNLIASMFGFKKAEFFEIGEEAERETPKVKF